MYEIWTSKGLLPNLYSRNQLKYVRSPSLNLKTCHHQILLKEVAKNLSGQGYDRWYVYKNAISKNANAKLRDDFVHQNDTYGSNNQCYNKY